MGDALGEFWDRNIDSIKHIKPYTKKLVVIIYKSPCTRYYGLYGEI